MYVSFQSHPRICRQLNIPIPMAVTLCKIVKKHNEISVMILFRANLRVSNRIGLKEKPKKRRFNIFQNYLEIRSNVKN